MLVAHTELPGLPSALSSSAFNETTLTVATNMLRELKAQLAPKTDAAAALTWPSFGYGTADTPFELLDGLLNTRGARSEVTDVVDSVRVLEDAALGYFVCDTHAAQEAGAGGASLVEKARSACLYSHVLDSGQLSPRGSVAACNALAAIIDSRPGAAVLTKDHIGWMLTLLDCTYLEELRTWPGWAGGGSAGVLLLLKAVAHALLQPVKLRLLKPKSAARRAVACSHKVRTALCMREQHPGAFNFSAMVTMQVKSSFLLIELFRFVERTRCIERRRSPRLAT